MKMNVNVKMMICGFDGYQVRHQQSATLEFLVLNYVLVLTLSKELGNEPFLGQRFMELPIISIVYGRRHVRFGTH